MNIIINGLKKSISGMPDINSLLKAQGYEGKLVAVARNGEFVPREAYARTHLEDGDEIEIVAPMQGG